MTHQWSRTEPHLLVKLLSPTARAPNRVTPLAAGVDLHIDLGEGDSKFFLGAGDRKVFGTGLAVRIPGGHYGRIADRSGMAAKFGFHVLGGVVDEDYRGEVKVVLLNTGSESAIINHGDRIAQLVLEKVGYYQVMVVDELDETVRGSAGFGSTGM